MEALKNRLSREYNELSNAKKVVYAVLLVAAVTVTVLLLSGAWDPFAVQTGATKIVKKH